MHGPAKRGPVEAARAVVAPDGGLCSDIFPAPQADMAVAGGWPGSPALHWRGIWPHTVLRRDIDAGIRSGIGRIYDFQVPRVRSAAAIRWSCSTARRSRSRTSAPDSWAAVGLLGGADEKLVIRRRRRATGQRRGARFYDVPGVEVVLLYPKEDQPACQEDGRLGGMFIRAWPPSTTASGWSRNSLDSSFRAAHRVSSANSINLRWIPQVAYLHGISGGGRRGRRKSGGRCRARHHGNLGRHAGSPRAASADSSRRRTPTTWCLNLFCGRKITVRVVGAARPMRT